MRGFAEAERQPLQRRIDVEIIADVEQLGHPHTERWAAIAAQER